MGRTAMPHADLTASVRGRVEQLFAELDFGPEICREIVLIRDGNYCGRRFEAAGGHAVWFAEEDQLKLVSDRGSVVRVFEQVASAGRDLRAAA
jgi:hypothetical protein